MKADVILALERFSSLAMDGEALLKNNRVTCSPRTKTLENAPMRANMIGCALVGHARSLFKGESKKAVRFVFEAAYGTYVNFKGDVSESDPPDLRDCFAASRILGLPAELLYDLHVKSQAYHSAYQFVQYLQSGRYSPEAHPRMKEFESSETRRLAQKQ